MTSAPTPADASPRTFRRPLRALVGAAAAGSALCAAVGVTAHFLGPVSTVVTLLASFTPLFVLLAIISAVTLVAARLWRSAAAALAVVLVGVGSQLPQYIGERMPSSPGASQIRIMQANLRLGEADPRAVVSRVRDSGVDVLTVAELTVPAADSLRAAGLAQVLPYSFLYARRGGGGEGIYSRFPLSDTAELPGLQHSNLRATIQPRGARRFAVYALHPLPPYPEPAWRWAHELDRIREVFAAEELPFIVGADFNSTYDHERYRRLVQAGARDGAALVDASDYLGSGIVATYPADRWFPAVLALDRILTRGGTPLSFHRIELPGSDHYGVLGDVRLSPPGHG